VLDFDQAVRELESAVAVALGEQENGTARLEAAVVAFRAALEEYKHDQMPLD
jgi:exonuclease VII small subunit